MRPSAGTLVLCVLVLACSAPVDERSTQDGNVAHPRCESCHAAAFEEVDEPPHSGELPATCFVCHTQRAWAPARLEHDFFPLTGAHLGARCFNCHIIRAGYNEPRYEGIDGDCVDCHRGDYDRSDFPGHGQFPLTCAECHSTSAWSPTLHPPSDASVERDAGVDVGLAGVGGILDGLGSASWRREGPTGVGIARDAGTAGTHRTPHRRPRPPPPTTGTEPPPTTVEPPPPTQVDVGTHASRRY